jgi:serine/threonine-protein kinase
LVRNEEESLVKVLDFGVAKLTTRDLIESGLTRPGAVVGTPYYMSPEQIQGSREIDHRVDLWALAAIACECLTGRRPFEAPDFAQLAVLLLGNVRRPLPSSLGSVPHGFDAWFLRATDQDINRRVQSAREMAQSLAAICDVSPSSGGEPVYPSYPSRPPQSTRPDAPSMAPVTNTASRVLLPVPLWQRPMAKLVGATVATTLVVTCVFGFWIASRGTRDHAHAEATPPVVTSQGSAPPQQGSSISPPPAGGFGVRPIREHDEALTPPSGPHINPNAPGADIAPPSSGASTTSEDAEREALARRVRAAHLARGEAAHPPKRRHAGKGTTAATKGSAPVATQLDAPSSHTPAPPPATVPLATTPPATTPPASNKPAPEPAPHVVDGRLIRTSL